MPKAKFSAIGMAVIRKVLLKELVDESSEGPKLTDTELRAFFDKWAKIEIPNMRNIISEERSRTRGHGEWESDFLRLKRHSMYDYSHDNSLPGQGQEKIVYISRCQHARLQVGWTLLGGCSSGEILSISG